MHFAAVYRMARLSGKPLGGWAIHHCRVAMSILVFSSALLLNTQAAYAQGTGPVDAALEAIPLGIAPLENVENRAVTSTPSDLVHEIVAGDTLTNVAQRYNVEAANLAAYNQILDYNHVVLGQKLRIPPVGVTIVEPTVEGMPGADGYHVVLKGESLSTIARLYQLTLEELMTLNEIDSPNIVQMGKMLRLTADVEVPSNVIPSELAGMTYKVKRGDTLSEIAQAYATTIEQIAKDNGLSEVSGKNLRVGQELRIFPPASAIEAFGVDAPLDGERKIVIDLSDQTLTAYHGDVVVLHTFVSTGKDATPTRTGEYAIYLK